MQRNYKPVFYSLLIFFLIIFSIVNTAHALTGSSGKHFLWTVEGRSNTVYIMGSIHVLKQNSYPLPRTIENSYDCCKTLVFETDVDTATSPEAQIKIMQLGLYPAGQTLSQNISSSTYSKLKSKLEQSGLAVAQFEQYKPWMVAQLLSGMEFIRLGYDPNIGIDRHFFNKAKRDGKELLFLESNEFQMNLMANLSDRNQDFFLKGVLKELDIIETMAEDMINAWKRGDTGKLESIISAGYSEHRDIYDRFIVKRNKTWITKIENFLRQHNDILVIVGSGHLTGKDGVIELLKKKGYKTIQR